MKEQNSLTNIMLDIQAIEETQQGQLVGGFAAVGTQQSALLGIAATNSCTVINVYQCKS